MKRIGLFFCLLAGLVASASATVNVVVSGGALRDAFGATLSPPPGSLVAVVASTQDNVFQTPTALSSLEVGTTFGGDDVVLAVFPADSLYTAVNGGFVGVVSFDYAAMGIPGLGAGDQLTLYWFPVAGLSAKQILTNAAYGSYRTEALINRSSTTWLAPDDSTGGTVELNFLTQAAGGVVDDALAIAVQNVGTTPSDLAYVTSVALGPIRNDYSGWVGMQIVVGASPLTVTQLGRIMAPGNSGTHTVKLVQASDGTDVLGGSVAIAMSGGTVGEFRYGILSSPVTLAAGAVYWVLSQETAGGDNWYDYYTTVTTTGVATDNAVAWGTGPGAWNTYGVVNQSFVPVNFKYASGPAVDRTLTVASSSPNSGVSVTVSPTDKGGLGNGVTAFTRTYNNNTVVTLTAPATAGGNNFQKWQKDGVDWSTNLSTTTTMDADHTLTAVYGGATIAVTVQTSPSGRTFTVDGTSYSSSQTFSWISGSSHTIATSSPQSGGTGMQNAWTGWSDGGAISHTVSPTSATTYTAGFKTQYYLTMNAGTGGTVSPASGWYDASQSVLINAVANSENSFGGWTGGGSGSYSGLNNPATVTMNGPITETAAFGFTGGDTAYVTSVALGPIRNDYSGWVGMQIVVGANPLTVSQLGRIMAPGNSGTHTVKLVQASDGTDVLGGSVAIAMSGGTVGEFRYGILSSPVTLAAGAVYWVLSQETAGGDNWYDYYTTVTTTGVATDNAVAWGTGPGAWNTYAVANQSFVPVNFKYTSAPPATAYVTGVALGPIRNDYSGWVGMQIVVGANPLTVSQLGRIVAPGNSGTHTVKLVKASDGTDVLGGSAAVATSGGTVGEFRYGILSSPVTLAAGAVYWVLSQETAGGDNWYDYYTTVTTTGVATDNAVAWGTGPGAWNTYAVANQSFVPVNFKYTSAAPATAYVTSTVLGPVRNDYSGWVGMQIVVGANPLTVSQLGRIVAPGNSGTHTVKLVQASDGTDVLGGSVAVAMSGGTVGEFRYGILSSPVTLVAGAVYWVLSQETAGGDTWYDYYTTVTTTAVATDNAVAWGTGPGAWNTYPVVNQSFVPVNFKY